MKKVTYRFNEEVWGLTGMQFNYDDTPELEEEILLLRRLYPEIADWGDFSIFTAWGSFSQDQYDLKWYPIGDRDDLFLAYLFYVEKDVPDWQWSEHEAHQAVEKIYE